MRTSLRNVLCIAVVAVPLTACRTGINAITDIPTERLEELANFTCVTTELAASLRNVAPPSDPRHQRAALLYESTREGYNGIIQSIASDVERGQKIDVMGYWNRFGASQVKQRELAAFAEQQSGFGFVGIGALISAATPIAQRLARRFIEQKVRSAAAGYMRREFMLPTFETAPHCVKGN